MKNRAILLALLFWAFALSAQEPLRILFEDGEGCLRYTADGRNNYMPDFSQAGYKNGDVPLPDWPVVLSIAPVAGDNTAHIQAAIDEVGAMPLDEAGHRGVVLLEAGLYEVAGTITIGHSGIVLRGVGQGEDPSQHTLIRATGNSPQGRDVIRAGAVPGVNWNTAVPSTRAQVTSPVVPAGSRSLQVAAPELYSVGDVVIVYQPSTSTWLADINFGDTAGDAPWAPGEIDLYYKRTITAINFQESKITLDVPVFDRLERGLAQSEVYRLQAPGIRREIGIEQLRIEIATAGPQDAAHARNAIRFMGVEDCWARDVTALHFSYAAVDMTYADRVTVQGCSGLAPHSPVDGGWRYNFAVNAFSNNILFQGCHATRGRHAYVSNGASTASNIVFHNCSSTEDLNTIEGHRRWSQGLLFDNIDIFQPQTTRPLGLYNRGSFGTGHGWSATHSVAWNVRMPVGNRLLLQRPPNRQNYAIGCQAIVTAAHQFNHPIGYEEGTGSAPLIPSLYEAQLAQRRALGLAPDAPARLQAAFVGDAVVLSWLDVAAQETGYVVEVSYDDGATFEAIAELPADTDEFADTNTDNFGGIISYRVFATGGCPSPYSNVAKAATVTSTSELAIPELSVFPNPVGDRLYITVGNREGLTARLFDSRGQFIQQQPIGTAIDCSGWASGLYFLKVTGPQGQQRSLKIVKP